MIKFEEFRKKGNKILIQYKRAKNRDKIGVVVAIGPGILGWSLCNSWDIFDREKGLSIAIERAMKSATLNLHDRPIYYDKCPHSLGEEFIAIYDRSFAYFKI